MATLIVGGGEVFFPAAFLCTRQFQYVIAVDAGVLAAEKILSLSIGSEIIILAPCKLCYY